MKPLGYTEKIGRCVIRKVREYGYKYKVSWGTCFKHVATIRQARELAASKNYISLPS